MNRAAVANGLLEIEGDFCFGRFEVPSRLAYRSHWVHTVSFTDQEWPEVEITWTESGSIRYPVSLAWVPDVGVISPTRGGEALLACDPLRRMARPVARAGRRRVFSGTIATAAGRVFALEDEEWRDARPWRRRIVEVELGRRRVREVSGPWSQWRVWDFAAGGEYLWISEYEPGGPVRVWRYGLAHRDAVLLATLPGASPLSASADGRVIVCCEANQHVRVANDGTVIEQVPGEGLAIVSPDGHRTAGLRDAATLVVRAHPTASSSEVLFATVPGDRWEYEEAWQRPAWSDDSRYIAVALRRRRQVVACVVDLERRLLSATSGRIWRHAAWEPGGRA